MSNVLSDEKKQQVIALGKLGWPLRRIEQATGVRRETASAYLKAAGIVVRLPRFWGKRVPAKPANEVTPDPKSKPANEVTPDFIAPFSRKPGVPSVCEEYRDLVEQSLALGRNAKAIWQDLVSDHGFAGGYEAVKRFVRKLRGPQRPEPAGIILTAPGEEAQVDYGSGPMVRDPHSGKYRRTRLFVLTLGYSRKSVRLLAWCSSARIWAELHEKAFRRLGGCPRIVVLDNLKEGVAVPDIYDPTVNPLFKDVLAHYGVVALPCRVQDPDRKGKVEAGIGHAQKTPLKGQRSRASNRLKRISITGNCVGPIRAFIVASTVDRTVRYYQYGDRVVHLDGCVEVEAAFYSSPPGWIGRLVHVQWDQLRVRLLDPATHQLLREHVRQLRGRHRIHLEDNPKKTPQTTTQ